ANELKIPHVGVSLIYMGLQGIIIVGCLSAYSAGYGYWYLVGIVLMLSLLYLWFMRRYYKLHGQAA
ncbi:MAG: UDP-GlcNAc--UDP-phosphate GlcNAc-1-phosphate transferase, partial [Prevotellaceae bacterium]|nr:UDP-GlcNAc--UDP-phosphate GlcNAc-1-phosphate transferase [Prevotellaceae bacterium]